MTTASIGIPPRKIAGVDVTAIGYGAMGLGGLAYGEAGTDEERFLVLDRLVELGCTNWDTADIYGDSEELIGKWFARTGNRSKIFLATKFGIVRTAKGAQGDPEYVRKTFNASLKKLQTDYVDLLYQHRSDNEVPVEVTIRAMKEFVDQGKVKYLGLSEALPSTIRRAHKVHPISAVQVEYNPWELSIEKPGGILETCRELGIPIVAYAPTARGMATGRWRSFDDLPEGDWRRGVPRYAAENWPRINNLVDSFKTIAAKYNATPAQLGIAWLLTQGSDIIPIPGSKQLKYVEENLAAATLVEKLKEEDLLEIRKLANEVNKDFEGFQRYPQEYVASVLQETPAES